MESIIFTTQIAPDLERYLSSKSYSKLGVIMDSNTHQACYPLIQAVLPAHEHFAFEAGEVNKTLDTCQKIWQWMTDCGFDRQSLIINLGGGVTGDMGGFCASTYKRGLRFLNIPTSLLSQVDASVGGKLGVDFNGFKNHIGVFNEPESVIISASFLQTLPHSELRSGYAEVLKHGLIRNENYYNSLKTQNWETQNWKDIIEKSVSIKKEVVSKDPKEEGLRKILNFGHTVGHAVESYYLDTERHLLHGEAIAVGMIAEAYLSTTHIRLPKEDLERINDTLLTIFGKVEIPAEDIASITQLCFQDKKNDGKTINCSLLKKIGECDYNIAVSTDDISKSLEYYNDLQP